MGGRVINTGRNWPGTRVMEWEWEADRDGGS